MVDSSEFCSIYIFLKHPNVQLQIRNDVQVVGLVS